MTTLYEDPWFTFRFSDDRIIPRFHLEGIEAGRRVSVFKMDPGTPGHSMFFRDLDRLCIAGDVLANLNFLTGKPGLREPPSIFTVDVAQNHRSIQTLVALKPKVVCFGHGPPLRKSEVLEEFVAKWT